MKSFYHHLSNQEGDGGSYEGEMSDFLKEWSAGELPYGAWVQHIHSWTTGLPPSFLSSSSSSPASSSPSPSPHILYLRYEEMKKDLPGTLQKIALFLDRSPLSPSTLSSLLSSLSFEGMRKEEEKYHPVSVKWKEGFHFIRQGETTPQGKGEGREKELKNLFSSLIYPQLPLKKEVEEGRGGEGEGGEEEKEEEGSYESDVEWLDDVIRLYGGFSLK